MANININGKTAVHAKSDGKLITVSTCKTPPFCVPVSYTNQAESKDTDMGASSVNIQGSPACNSKSNFKKSMGDAPGACGGTSSGTTCQMAEFIASSSNVTIGGNPAVRNGDQMVSNLKNTPPQPLMQPPAGNAPAGTAEAPAASTGEFSQQFDLSKYIGLIPGGKEVLERPNYKITDKEGTLCWEGTLSNKGLTERVFTSEKKDLVVWVGDGEWKILGEHAHGTD